MLSLSASAHTAMLAHAIAGLPNEACGLFAGPPGENTVDTFYAMTNVAASSQIYRLDGQELVEVEASADRSGRQILGVMHSHTHTTAYPSPTDVEDAARFDPFGTWVFLIVSLKHADPVLRGYRILDGSITEEKLSVVGYG